MDKTERESGEQRVFRLRAEIIKVYDYVDYRYKMQHGNSKFLDTEIFKYALDMLKDRDLKQIHIKAYKPKRNEKGFTVHEGLLGEFDDFHKNYAKPAGMLKAELLELFIFVYAQNNLTAEELRYQDLSFISL